MRAQNAVIHVAVGRVVHSRRNVNSRAAGVADYAAVKREVHPVQSYARTGVLNDGILEPALREIFVDVIGGDVVRLELDSITLDALRVACRSYLVADVVVGRNGDVAHHRALCAHYHKAALILRHETPGGVDAVIVAVKAAADHRLVVVVPIFRRRNVESRKQRSAVFVAVGDVGAEHYISVVNLFARLEHMPRRIIQLCESLCGARRDEELVDVVYLDCRDHRQSQALRADGGIARIARGHRKGDFGTFCYILCVEYEHVASCLEIRDVGVVGSEDEVLVERGFVRVVGGRRRQRYLHLEHVVHEVLRTAVVDGLLRHVHVRIEPVRRKHRLSCKPDFERAVVKRKAED